MNSNLKHVGRRGTWIGLLLVGLSLAAVGGGPAPAAAACGWTLETIEEASSQLMGLMLNPRAFEEALTGCRRSEAR